MSTTSVDLGKHFIGFISNLKETVVSAIKAKSLGQGYVYWRSRKPIIKLSWRFCAKRLLTVKKAVKAIAHTRKSLPKQKPNLLPNKKYTYSKRAERDLIKIYQGSIIKW